MPQINRVRIINFSYNNNNRNIVDETFDYYQGENALLSLQNGGGKSVLVQVMLQPIIPKVKLMRRRIEDFFKGRKTPSYIMIEWKLEGGGGYLLTGIGLANRESRIREQDDSSNQVKYFTFMSHYRSSNLFDIENIPLIRKSSSRIYVEEFNDARKLIKAKEEDREFNVRLYTQDDEDRKRYRADLQSFNIFQDEWESIVLKINESEGGVIEIFEKCRTSQQLMNEWILKSVEKVVNKDDGDHQKLELMLENLVEEMIKNEQFIHEKEIYQEFLFRLDDFLKQLNALIHSLDEEKKAEKAIGLLYYYLKHELNMIEEDLKSLDGSIAASRDELKRIDLEERSKEFYDSLKKVQSLELEAKDADQKLSSIKEQIDLSQHEEAVQMAARDYGSIKRLAAGIASIKEEIDKIKGDGETSEKIKNLEYSLKISYERLLESLNGRSDSLKEKRETVDNELSGIEVRIKEIDKSNSNLQNEKGKLQGKVESFLEDERKLKNQLQFYYQRNLLGEIDREDIDNYIDSLKNKASDLNNKKDEALDRIGGLEKKIHEINEKLPILNQARTEKTVLASELDREIEKYTELEESVRPVLGKYDIDFKNRFNHKENQLYLQSVINEYSKRERDLEFSIKAEKEKITSLENGTLHVSSKFRQFLINNDIDFETGENYLRKQSEGIKDKLIANNPVLPYAFILYDDDIERLSSMDIDESISQLVPILSYRDVDHSYNRASRLLSVHDRLRFLCLYDRRMFDAESLESYIVELNEKVANLKDQLQHYKDLLEAGRVDLQLLREFGFDKNYFYQLTKNKEKALDDIESLTNQIGELERNRDRSLEEINLLRDEIKTIEKGLEALCEKETIFNRFLQHNDLYIRNNRLIEQYSKTIKNNENEKDTLTGRAEELKSSRDELIEEQTLVRDQIRVNQDRLHLYADSKEGIFIDDTLESLEARLSSLKSEMTSNLQRLESDLKDKQAELSEKDMVLKSYGIDEKVYTSVIYNRDKLVQIQALLKRLGHDRDKADKVLRKTERTLEGARAAHAAADREVRKLAEEPIALELIKLNFDERRNKEHNSIKKAEAEIKRLASLSKDYENLTIKIENIVDVGKLSVDIDYEVKENVNADFKKLSRTLKNIQEENERYTRNIYSQYLKLKSDFTDRNEHIKNIFLGLDPQIEGAEQDRDKYYYLGDRILDNTKLLGSMIKACDQRLANVEKNKADMVIQSYYHARRVYNEIQRIPENSSIRLEGKNRSIPMLRINMEPLEETDEANRIKMQAYIEDCVGIIKEDMKANKKGDEIRPKIRKYMSTKELLNVISDLGKMSIHAYKIDINIKNSGYKSWEQVMKENSGGERFVSFFVVLVALMSYTRMERNLEDDYQRNTDSKVLIMDNPFGPISSEHLLKPLFSIAEKYNTQLICLSDLKQNSIMNCFNLIYMIKIRQNIFGTSEYLQLEKQIKEDAVLETDEHLEKAIFKSSEGEQQTLF